ncbi:MAG: aldo/keto reductase [Alteraurantiacibacter sp. bin_em_oilr2.035]|nr:aldo/keto reductase [Aurantiacibacter atlanticus]MDF1833552.1 aldo/keto reductase [Alteraurantiacibacter sp. bin_em_oilr2.035]
MVKNTEATPIPEVRLGPSNAPLKVSAMGLGCMGMSEFYGPRDDEQSLTTLNRALDLGVTFLDTAETYGLGHNEELVGRLIAERGRDAVTIATKFGILREPGAYARVISNDPAYIREACEKSLKRLGTDYIDLYYIHRIELDRPIDEPMEALARLVEEGKIGHIGICEASPATLRRANTVHQITALQSEYSLWTRDPEDGVFAACRELGIGFVPYSPLGRGFLTGAMNSTEDLAEDDARRSIPRFEDANVSRNLFIVQAVQKMAEDKGCKPAQIALAWVIAQGQAHDVPIVPIPGTKRVQYLEENVSALSVELTPDDIEELNRLVPPGAAAGERYPAEGMKGLNA